MDIEPGNIQVNASSCSHRAIQAFPRCHGSNSVAPV
jgi:hypothetical protein